MAGGDACTLSLCVYSAELDSAANGAYCKIYVDANDRTHGSGGTATTAASSHDAAVGSPDPSRTSDASSAGARSFHTHVEKSEKKTFLPTWNETFTIDVYDRRHEILTIRLKSKKLLHVSVVGACAIPLHQIPTGQLVDQWFPVQKGGKRRGKLRLQMMVTYPPPPLASVGTPQERIDPRAQPAQSSMQQQGGDQRYAGYHDPRRSLEQRSSGGSASLHQRPSSLSSQPSDYGRRSQTAAVPSAQQQQEQPQSATLATYGYEPEDEPPKERSPLKDETYEIYRPATNPRLDLESDDDDETSFPRVAELHRLESDLIGESSDEEVEAHGPMPKSPLYLERLTEAESGSGGEEGSPSFSALSGGRASDAPNGNVAAFEAEASLTVDSFKPQAAVDTKPTTDRRTSVEVTRQTKVAVPVEDLDRVLEASAVTASSYDDADEGIDMSGIVDREVNHPRSPSVGSYSSDVVVGEVVSSEMAQDVWNRYSSSSSEELQLPYADEEVDVARSSVSSDTVYQGIPVSIHEANPFVEPGSPKHSSDEGVDELDAQQRYDSAVTPRDSISSDGGDHSEFFGSDSVDASAEPTTSSPRATQLGENAQITHGSRERNHSSPRNSWVSEDVKSGRDASLSRTSWISEVTEQTPARVTGRDKAWSGTSWISEHEHGGATKEPSPRSSWISEHSEVATTSQRVSGRDKSYSGTSWISEQDSTNVVDAVVGNEALSPRHSWVSEKSEANARHSWISEKSEANARQSWVSEKSEMNARHSWVSEKSEANARHSWVSEKSDVVTSELHSPSPPARLTGRDKSWSGTSWINENDNTSFVDATGPRSSWISEDGESNADDARHSWVSEGVSESTGRVTGREKSVSGTSWISENDNNSFTDAPGPAASSRSSWISENDDQDQDTFDSKSGSSTRTSWVHEDGALPPARLTGRDKSWSGTSWISEHENTSFVDATGLRSSWLGDDGDADAGESASPRHSWVSEGDAESAARLKGREKSWSGTSWVSEHDNTSFSNAPNRDQHEASRTSWVSEHPDEENADVSRHSWVSESASEAPSRLNGRDKSWSGTSWISEHDNTSFVNASGPPPTGSPRSSWISEDVGADEEDSSSPRHSWVSEKLADDEAHATGRDKSWSRTSWVSERENSSFVDASDVHQTGSPRSSWISEADSALPDSHKDAHTRTSWISERGSVQQQQTESPRSWISEEMADASQAAAMKQRSPRHSWVSESDHASGAIHSPRTSWISESVTSEVARRPSSPRNSWASEDPEHQPSGSPRNSWVSEESHSEANRRRLSSSQTSWVNENANSNSFVDASFARHSFVSEGSEEDRTEQAIEDASVAILPAPVRDSVDASSPARVSLLSEISDIIEAERDISPRSSISADPTSEPASQTDTFVSDRISAVSSVDNSDRQPHGVTSVEAQEPLTPARDSYSSDAQVGHPHFEISTTPRDSGSSARLSIEEDESSAPRVSFVSDELVAETGVEVDISGPPTPPSANEIVSFREEGIRSEEFIQQAQSRSSEEGRSSGYDGDNIETSTTRSSSLFSDAARERTFEDSVDAATPRSSSSSESDLDAYRGSSYTESYTDLTRHSSISSVSVDNIVDRDDAEKHAEAVAEAARYSSSSEGDFDRDDHGDLPSALKIQVAAPRRFSSASEDTVDRGSSSVGFEYDDMSTGRSHSSSTAARDEAQFAAWTEESSTNGDFGGAMRRGSQATLSDMYDASPRTSDLGVILESQARVSHGSQSSSVSLEFPPAESTTDMRRFISAANVFVEPYDDETPRSSSSHEVIAQTITDEVVEVVDTVDLHPISSARATAAAEALKVTVTVELPHDDAKPAAANPFVEYGSPMSSSSSEGEFLAELHDHQAELTAVSMRSSNSSEGDHEVVVVETLDQLAGPVEPSPPVASAHEVVAAKPSRVSSITSDRLSVTAPHVNLDTLLATREYVDAGDASPISSLSSTTSPRDPSTDGIVAAHDLLERAVQQVEHAEQVATTSETTVSAPVVTTTTVRFSIEEDETKTEAPARANNVRGDHVLVSSASSLTRAQLQSVAQDFLPSDDSESEEYDSDAELNFDSDDSR